MIASRPRMLCIAYQFPPVGGAGVQRVAKFAKFLPQHGWDVSVLTVSNPSTPLSDESLTADIPPETVVCRARTWEPHYAVKSSLSAADSGRSAFARVAGRSKAFAKRVAASILQPDPQILWLPAAFSAGRRLLATRRHSVIFASGPPFSSFLLAARLAQVSRLPLVLDYRDEWTISNRYWENKGNGRWTQWVSRQLQTQVLRQADLVLATTDESREALAEEVQRARSSAVTACIPNGYDPDDLNAGDLPTGSGDERSAEASPGFSANDRPYRIAHIGTLWRLTTVAPLLAAMERLAERNPRAAARLQLEFLGRCTPPEQALLDRLSSHCPRLVLQGYAPHQDAVRMMHAADELCVLLADVPEAARVMPAKTFEYLATGRPILAIAPPGAMRRTLSQHSGVAEFSPSDVSGICEHLERCSSVGQRPAPHVRDLSALDRCVQAGRLARHFEQLTTAASHAPASTRLA
ncbi:MAG: glycosyltransferase [Pirellulales bacterium]